MEKCSSGKRIYYTKELAEDALITTQSVSTFEKGKGPIAIYQCDECGNFHLTSRGPMNDKLETYINSGKLNRDREANQWLSKLKKK